MSVSVYTALFQNRGRTKKGAYRPQDEYGTPQDLFDWLNEVMDTGAGLGWHFTVDAAASPRKHMVRHYWTRLNSALDKDWSGHVVFCNPPYGGVKEWMIKSTAEAKRGATVVMLVPVFVCDGWFQEHCASAEVIFLRGRVRFVSARNPKGTQAWFGSCLMIFRPTDTPSIDGRPRVEFSDILYELAKKAPRKLTGKRAPRHDAGDRPPG